MTETPRESPFSATQLAALVHGMMTTARIDGIHPAEESLIRKFYDEQRGAGTPALESLPAADVAALAGDTAFAEQMVLMCLMTAYADGGLSDAERAHVAGMARQLGVSAERQAELLQQVRDTLLGSLAHLPDAESVAALAKDL